jgi:hypothetical protein
MTLILVLFLLVGQAFGQGCFNNQFVVQGGGKNYLTINSPTEVFTCGDINICSILTDSIQSLSIANDGTLSLSKANSIQLPDSSSTNEIQSLSLSSDTSELAISGSNSIKLPDSSATNEIQSLSISGTSLSISNGNTIQLPITAAQTLALSMDKTTLSISDGNSVTLPDSSNTNELQSLNLSGSQLSLSSGNSVDLSTVPSTRATFTIIPHGTVLPLALTQLAALTVTPPGRGSVLTRLCGGLTIDNTAYSGVIFYFSNTTIATGQPSYWEGIGNTGYRAFCTEKWWPVTNPGVPVTYNVQGYRGLQTVTIAINGDCFFSATFVPEF